MTKNIFFTALFALIMILGANTNPAVAQVHIGSLTEPKATLEVTGTKDDTKAPGIIAPRLTLTNLQLIDAKYDSDLKGAIVYVENVAGTPTGKTANVTAIGYYFFDGSVWQAMTGGGGGGGVGS